MAKVQNDIQKSWKKPKERPTTGTMSVDRPKGRLATSTITPHFHRRITSKTVSHKKVVSKPQVSQPDKTTWMQQALADEIVNAMSMGPSEISSGRSSCASSTSNTPKVQALKDPIAGLDEGVFRPADLIPRTPVAKQHYEATHTQRDHEQGTEKLIDVDSPKPGRLFEAILNQTTSAPTPDSIRTLLFPPTPSPQGERPTGSSLTPFSFTQVEQDHLGDLEDISEDDLNSLETLEAVSPQLPFTPCGRTGSSRATTYLAFPVMDDEASFVRSTETRRLAENQYPPLHGTDQQTELFATDPLRTVHIGSSLELKDFPEGLGAMLPSSFQSPLIQFSRPVIANNDIGLLVMDSETAAQESQSPHPPHLSPFGSYEPLVLGYESLGVAKPHDQNDSILVSEKVHSEGEYLFTLPKLDFNFNETNEKFKDSFKTEGSGGSIVRNSVTKQDDGIRSTENENGVNEDVSADKTNVSFARSFYKTAISLSPPRQVDTSELMRRLNRLKQAQRNCDLSSDRTVGPQRDLLSWSRAPMTPSSTPQDETRSPNSGDLFRRLEQIRQAQESQQVASAANTELTSIKTAAALTTPLTSTGAVTPGDGTEMGTKFSLNSQKIGMGPNFTQERFELSGISTPVSETYLLPSPEKRTSEEARLNGPVEKVFSLDLPSSHNKNSGTCGESVSPDEESGVFVEKRLQEKAPTGRTNYIPEQGPRKTPIRRVLDYERGSLMTTGQEKFLSNAGTTPSGTWLTNGARLNLSFEHLEGINESPFLVPASPFISNIQQDETSYLSPFGRQEPNNNTCSPSPLSRIEPLLTDTSLVVGQLVDLE